jgi:prepilin-type N-terminal cleavage/methylation domain-containing protein
MMFNYVGDLCPKCSRKAGFTLVELLVYMAILGVVVLVAGQALTDSTKIRVRTQNMLASSQNAENVASLLKDDIAQMGAKEYETEKY